MYGNKVLTPVEQVDQAFYFIIGVSVVVLTFVTALMIYFAIKYRRSKNPIPSDIRGNTMLEVIWTVIPSFLALAMFYFGWTSYLGLRNVPPDAIEVNVTGEMFNWIFEYPNADDKESENLLVVPVGKPIKINITSLDVLHAFYLPAFRIKIDAVPKMQTYAWFYPKKVGTYDILCAEYCGVDHAGMLAKLRIISEENYQKWLAGDDSVLEETTSTGETSGE